MKQVRADTVSKRRKQGQHVLVVSLKLTDGDMGDFHENAMLEDLEQRLMQALDQDEAGHYDGNEVGGGYYRMFMSGNDGERLFETVLPEIMRYPALRGSYLMQRCGNRGPMSRLVPLSVDPPREAAMLTN